MSEKYFTDLNDAILYDIISRSNLRTQMVHKWSRDDRIRKLASMDDWKRTEFDYDTIARQLNIGDVNGHGLQMMFNLLECSDNLRIIRCNRGHLSSHLFDLLSTSFQHLEVLDISHQALSDHQLDLVTAGHPGLKEINISSCLSLTDNAIKSLFSNCRCLEKITADDLDINGTYLNLLPSSCTSLSLLSSLDMNNIVKLACSPAQLSQLSIQFNTLVYVIPEFPLAFKSFSSLVKLTIVYGACCNEVRFLGISRLTKLKNLTIMAATHKFLNEDLVTIATSVPELEQLSVRYMNQGMPTSSLNDETLRFVTSSLKHLRILRIENAEDVTDNCPAYIGHNLSELRQLSFNGCFEIGDGLAAAVQLLPNLTHLDVRGTSCSLYTLLAFAQTAMKRPERKHSMLVRNSQFRVNQLLPLNVPNLVVSNE